jgi:hypothetical protein
MDRDPTTPPHIGVTHHELARKNVRWGLALLGLSLLLFAGSIVVAIIYNAAS